MYVAITGAGKARVIHFREDTRIPGTQKKQIKVIETLGNYERMLAYDPDIVAKLKVKASQSLISQNPVKLSRRTDLAMPWSNKYGKR
ncbi:hypothetical protein [Fusibacter sp. 3D3]|uniref:hypothetical protein n=1 Tax=Fusibacter sp. 3D3 TaxID=1048380 RepID=UPI0008529B07|nr:hypothetical protein [Fusibacter sp. 3D3]GAU76745.1 hypothetical protein F3D3_1342 [Fusibacter sp. 3D3]